MQTSPRSSPGPSHLPPETVPKKHPSLRHPPPAVCLVKVEPHSTCPFVTGSFHGAWCLEGSSCCGRCRAFLLRLSTVPSWCRRHSPYPSTFHVPVHVPRTHQRGHRYWGRSPLLAFVKKERVCTSMFETFSSFGCVPRSGIAESYSDPSFIFSGCCAVFHGPAAAVSALWLWCWEAGPSVGLRIRCSRCPAAGPAGPLRARLPGPPGRL